jgi:hypothetical protein
MLFAFSRCFQYLHTAISQIIFFTSYKITTYDHRTLKIRLPVRSAIYKQCTGGLVVRWVTTSESPLLYVFCIFFSLSLLFLPPASSSFETWVSSLTVAVIAPSMPFCQLAIVSVDIVVVPGMFQCLTNCKPL